MLTLGVTLLLATSAVALDDETACRILEEAKAAGQPYRNAVYLYLRLAGIAWIGAEWVAAVLLWLTYRLLLRAARQWGLAS